MDELLAQAHQAAKAVLAAGADHAEVGVSRSRGVDLEWRDGQLERVQERTQRSLGVEVYVDGRYSASSTNDLRPEALEAFFAEAVANTRLLEPDEHRRLTDPARYAGRAQVDLDQCDPHHSALAPETRREEAQALEARVRELGSHLPIVSVATSVSDNFGQSARVHTNGFEGAREGTSYSRSAMITCKEPDGRRPMGWDYSARRHRSDLADLEAIAQGAVTRTAGILGAGKLKTGRYTVVVENRAVRRLLGALLGPLGGGALHQKRSLWDGKLGQQIASELLTIIDDPFVPRGMGSSLWDTDGAATVKRPIIERGVLKTFLIGEYYGRKLGVPPTGPDTHNFQWDLGTLDRDALVAGVGEGVLIDRFLGGNSNSTTGEISLGCGGRVIRNGQLAEAVAEVNLAGHFGQLWEQLVAVGGDPDPNSSAACPSCVFRDVQLSGV
ncbi:MAG: TldD/PmbA family protein [Myxococcales bacterium]|nr:TldD/PmbA family protein [Myxococcales bacterium]